MPRDRGGVEEDAPRQEEEAEGQRRESKGKHTHTQGNSDESAENQTQEWQRIKDVGLGLEAGTDQDCA